MSEQDSINHQLCIRFLRKPRKCRKINDSFIGSEQRIICINNETLYYYPKIQQFQNLDFDKLQYAVPKAGVKLIEIEQLKFPPRFSNQRHYFSIIFPKNKILKFTKTFKQMVVDQHVQGQQIWTFEFDLDIISLPQCQNKLRQKKLHQQQINKQKRLEQIKSNENQQLLQRQQIEKQYQLYKMNDKIQVVKALDHQAELKKKLEQADEFEFISIYQKLFEFTFDQKQLLLMEFALLEKINKFMNRAQETVRQFVDQLPYSTRNLQEQINYELNNLKLKIGGKSLNQQFLANHLINTLLHEIQNNLMIRVPLLAFVKYKGSKVLVRAKTPIDLYTDMQLDRYTLHGNCNNNWKISFTMTKILDLLCDKLGLKSYIAQVYYQKVTVHFGTNVRIVQTKINPFKELKSFKGENMQKSEQLKIIYLNNISDVFPIDLDLKKNVDQSFIRLRPQFLSYYTESNQKDIRIPGGAMLFAVQDQEGERDDLEVGLASQHLKFIKLQNFVKLLDNLDSIIEDSQSYSTLMKQNGINIRYLGKIYISTTLPYIRQLSELEATSRCIKNIYRQHQNQFFQSLFKRKLEVKQLFENLNNPDSKPSLIKITLKQLKSIQKQESIINAIDFLNLVFGIGNQHDIFWLIIKQKLKQKYEINLKDQSILHHGYLLKAVLYHCGFDIIINQELKLFQNYTPFRKQNWINFKFKIKSFQYKNFSIYSKQYLNNNYSENKKITILELQLLLRRIFKKSQQDILIELSKYLNTIEKPKQFYSLQNLKYQLIHANVDNFNQCYKICQFLFPSSHPYFLDLYLTFTKVKQLDSNYLKKAAQNYTVRNLGLKHWKTADCFFNFKQLDIIQHLKLASIGIQQNRKLQLYLLLVQQLEKAGKSSQCLLYIRNCINLFNSRQMNEQEQQNYFQIIALGIIVSYKMRFINDIIKLTQILWIVLQKYNIYQHSLKWYDLILQYALKSHLQQYNKKLQFFIFVMVLDENNNFHKIIINQDRKQILQKLRLNFTYLKNHNNWIKQMFNKIQSGYQQLNIWCNPIRNKDQILNKQKIKQQDQKHNIFHNFNFFIKKIDSDDFRQGIKQLIQLIHLYGFEFFKEALSDQIYAFQQGNWNFNQNKI